MRIRWDPGESALGCARVRGCSPKSSDGADVVGRGGRIGIPFTWHPFEASPAAVREHKTRADDEVPHRTRHEHITGFRPRRNTCPDVHGEAANGCSVELDLACVDSDPYVESESAGVVADREATANGPSGAVEDGEEAGAGDVDLAPTKTSQQGSDALVVRCDEVAPRPVTQPCSRLGRCDDVREKDGREDTVEVHLGAVCCGEEPLDRIEELVLITREREVVGSRKLEQP